MGGVREKNTPYEKMKKKSDFIFIISGGSYNYVIDGNLYLLPFHSKFYHPDLINVCDVVVAKAGYSTLAEVYYSHKSFVYVKREKFKEVDVLESFIRRNVRKSLGISYENYKTGLWLESIKELCHQDNNGGNLKFPEDNAKKCAEYIFKIALK